MRVFFIGRNTHFCNPNFNTIKLNLKYKCKLWGLPFPLQKKGGKFLPLTTIFGKNDCIVFWFSETYNYCFTCDDLGMVLKIKKKKTRAYYNPNTSAILFFYFFINSFGSGTQLGRIRNNIITKLYVVVKLKNIYVIKNIGYSGVTYYIRTFAASVSERIFKVYAKVV